MRHLAYLCVAFAPPAFAQEYQTTWDSKGRASCSDFPTYQDARAYCLAKFGSTLGCGGLDRDQDSIPCECNKGGPEENEAACISKRKEGKS